MLRIAAIALTSLLLTGCASSTAPGPMPPETATATPTETAAVSTAPAHILDLTCPDVMPDDDLALLFGEASAPIAEDLLLTAPMSAALRNAGGITCMWGNDMPAVLNGDADIMDPARETLNISLLPATTAARWDEYASVYRQDTAEVAFGDGSGSACSAEPDYRHCNANILVGDVWIEFDVVGVSLDESRTEDDLVAFARPILERLVDRVAAASVSGAPSPTEVAPRTDCETILPVDAVKEVLGITEDGVQKGQSGEGGGGLSLRQDGATRAGHSTCIVGVFRSDLYWAASAYLPEGAWAFEPTAVENGVWDDAEPVAVDGADSAYQECTIGENGPCIVDMAIGSAWVRVSLPIDGEVIIDSAHRTGVLDLAGLVAANVD